MRAPSATTPGRWPASRSPCTSRTSRGPATSGTCDPMSAGRVVHVVVPAGVHDPARPSGGNTYDRRICRGLADAGWTVHLHAIPGGWPHPDAIDRTMLATLIAGLPDHASLLLDGLIASTVPDVLVPHAERLRLVVLVHMPLGIQPTGGVRADAADAGTRERAVLAAATAVVATSSWTRRLLLDRYPLLPHRIHVAEPGADPAEPAAGSAAGDQLLSVAAVAPHKGQDVLIDALGTLDDLQWRCVCAV